MRRAASIVRVLLLALLLVACATTAPAGPVITPPGARLLLTRQVQGRMWDLTVDSPALGKAVNVRLLLPVGYGADPARRWPVLYLFHGCCDDYLSWTRSTDIEPLSRGTGVLVVMPEGGNVGFYSDWLDGPGWETFHTVELPALLGAAYRAGGRQSVAGVSMGGLGALDYAAHHPGRYTAAASFSGIVHTRLSEDVTLDYRSLIRSQGIEPDALWGNQFSDADTWARHNPYDLADDLRGTRLFVSAGDGRPGPLDPPGAAPVDYIEASISAQNHALVERLRRLGVAAQTDLYAPGTHNWTYWQRELHRAWPLLTDGM